MCAHVFQFLNFANAACVSCNENLFFLPGRVVALTEASRQSRRGRNSQARATRVHAGEQASGRVFDRTARSARSLPNPRTTAAAFSPAENRSVPDISRRTREGSRAVIDMADYAGSSMAALAARHARSGCVLSLSRATPEPRRFPAARPRARPARPRAFRDSLPPLRKRARACVSRGHPRPVAHLSCPSSPSALRSRVSFPTRHPPQKSSVEQENVMDARVNFSQPVPDVEPQSAAPWRARRRAPGGRTRAEPPLLQVRRRRAGGVVVRGGPHGRHPPALDGDPPQGLRAPARPRGGPRAAGVLLQLRQRGRAPLPQARRGGRRRWTTT